MNILFYSVHATVSNRTFGGVESSIELLARHLKVRGQTVLWLSRTKGGFSLPRLRKLSVNGIPFRLFQPTKGEDRLKFIKELNRSAFRKYILQLLHENKIDIVYCHYDLKFLREMLELFRKEGLGTKIVMRMAGMHWYEQCLKEPSLVRNYESVFNSIDGVNFIHDGLVRMVFDKFKELGMSVKFKHCLKGDIGSSANIGREESYASLTNKDFTLIMATRFSKYQKRQDILVKAVSCIDRNIPIKLTLIGEGEKRQEIEEMILKLSLEDRIGIEPFKEQQALWEKLKTADMLCHACEYEGLGKIIIESMALGLPVLVSNVSPLNQYIKDGQNGFLVDNTVSEWATKIVLLYHKKAERARVSENEIEFIREDYDPKRNVELYEEFFSSLVRSESQSGNKKVCYE